MPSPTLFYIVVFLEDVPGKNYSIYTSMGTLLRWLENVRDDPEHYDFGPFDVFVVDTEALEVNKFDTKPLLTLVKRKKKS